MGGVDWCVGGAGCVRRACPRPPGSAVGCVSKPACQDGVQARCSSPRDLAVPGDSIHPLDNLPGLKQAHSHQATAAATMTAEASSAPPRPSYRSLDPQLCSLLRRRAHRLPARQALRCAHSRPAARATRRLRVQRHAANTSQHADGVGAAIGSSFRHTPGSRRSGLNRPWIPRQV